MIWSVSLPHHPGPRWSSPPLLLLPAGINPPITVAGERLAAQIEVFTSKPSLIQPSVREQLTSQDSLSLCARLIRNPEEHRGGEEKHTHTSIKETRFLSCTTQGWVKMEETYLLNYPGVRKKILAGGAGPLPHFPPGAKVINYSLTWWPK